jgi:5-methylcytosine-specific restriction endonuclease McrA
MASWESQALARIFAALDSVDAELRAIWHWGDGEGGYVIDELHRRYTPPRRTTPRMRRERIDADLRRQVYERDRYRCTACGTHKDLTLDHVMPVSGGGQTTAENLVTMCRPCNSRKGAREPGVAG